MEPVPVAPTATPTPTIPGTAPAPPAGVALLQKAAEERAQLNLDATEILSQEVRRSATITNLAKGLTKVQARLRAAERDSKNPFYKTTYASLASCWDAWRAAKPEDEGLSVIQLQTGRGRIVVVTTILLHESDEWIEQKFAYIAKDDAAQSVAGCVTYGRRVAFCAVTGVAPEDDDGEAASREKPAEGAVRWDKGTTDLQNTGSERPAPSAHPTAPYVAPAAQAAAESGPVTTGPARTGAGTPPVVRGTGTPPPPRPTAPTASAPPTAGRPPQPIQPTPQVQAITQPAQASAQQQGTVVGPPPPGMKPPTRAPGR